MTVNFIRIVAVQKANRYVEISSKKKVKNDQNEDQ